VLSIGGGRKIYLVAGVTDMRKSFDTLAAVVTGAVNADPLSGHMFVFCNRRRDRLKVLIWEESGFWLLAKRLEKGTFDWPDGPHVKIEYTPAELAALLDGLELSGRRKRRYRRTA
jgi:transposase